MITNFLISVLSKVDGLLEGIPINEEDISHIMTDINYKLESDHNFKQLCDNNIGFRKLVNELSLEKHLNLLANIGATHYYLLKLMEFHEEIKRQIELCETFLSSDMCIRSLPLKNLVYFELVKLKSIQYDGIVKNVIRNIDQIIQQGKPEMSKRKRHIELSEIMHYLEISDSKSFITLKDAQKIVDDKLALDPDYTQTAEDLISDRIKKILKK